MASSTAEEQWRALLLQVGAWEGNLCHYDPDGNAEHRQGTVLFLYGDTRDDKLKLERKQAPSALKLRLHRCTEKRDVIQSLAQGTDFAGRGLVFDSQSGHLCSGPLNVTPVPQKMIYIEKALNLFDGNRKLVARARLVTRFDSERLQAFAAFRERASSITSDTAFPEVSDELAESDLIVTDGEASVEALCGTWRGKLTRVQVMNGNVSKTSENYVVRTSIEGDRVRMEGPFGGVGTISSNRKTVLFCDVARQWRLVFLGGGLSAMCSLHVPKSGEELFAEFSWLVSRDLRIRSWRKYAGNTWVESCFAEEVRETP